MTVIIIYMLIMLALIYESEIVMRGAYDGLMLWFNNVIPLLLPFMLMSSIVTDRIKNFSGKSKKIHAVFTTLFTGLFCGYPLGSKSTSEFVQNRIYSKKTGELLLPICNNCSPMFISGYIVRVLLKSNLSFCDAIMLIYSPYILYIILGSILIKRTNKHTTVEHKQKKHRKKADNHIDSSETQSRNNEAIEKNVDYIMSTIIQITYVGFYIILCSIISEFVLNLNTSHEGLKIISAGLTEITKGTGLISQSSYFDTKTKSALVLSLTSFGGISSILQTNNIIKKSGLSLTGYIITKTICASATYGLALILL